MTTNKTASTTKKLTATQRIEGLESTLSGVMQNTQLLADEINNLRQTLGALGRRLNATIKSGESGQVSNDSVNQIITQENIAELKGKVEFLLEQGVLEAFDGEIGEKTFVIGRELDEEKNVINPRIQFAVASIVPEMKNMLVGKKVGDIVKNDQGDGLLLEVTEIFNIADKITKDVKVADEAAE